MNHYMLPNQPGNGREIDAKYGDTAISSLYKLMIQADPNVKNIEAIILGGASVTDSLMHGNAMNIGARNIETAVEMLGTYNIKVIRQETGGVNGLKILFQNWDNKLDVRLIKKSEGTKQIEARETHFSTNKIKVLVIDDSLLIQKILCEGLNKHPEIEVVGTAADAYEAREKILDLKPDLLTLDIIMPKMNGLQFLKKVMHYRPMPIIIVSSIAQQGSSIAQKAKTAGAVAVIDKEQLTLYKDPENIVKVLGRQIVLASRAMVNRIES